MEREPAIPYYVRVAETIRRRIVMDQYGDGDLIPPAQELEKEFHVSSITIRKALEILVQEGLIHRQRGKGTTVRKPSSEMMTFELSGSFQRLTDTIHKVDFKIEVLDISTPPCPREIQSVFSVDPEQTVWRMRKIRKHRNIPIAYYIHYSDPRVCKGITKREGERANFIDLMERSCGVKLARMEQHLRATVADLDLADVLKINFGAPLFFVENIYYDRVDSPVILTQMYYRGDMCSYRAGVQLNGRA